MFPGELRGGEREMGRGGDNVSRRRNSSPPHPLSLSPSLLILAMMLSFACRPPQKMANQPQYDALEESRFFSDGMSARPAVEGTIARGQLNEDTFFTTGKVGTAFATTYPFPITAPVMKRGQERFEIYCSMCHGRTGTGTGMIVQRGYRQPTSFHDPRLLQESPGYFFDVMTNGFGVMPPYRTMISPQDRWAIAAYIRALQLSQNATINDVPESDRWRLGGSPQ